MEGTKEGRKRGRKDEGKGGRNVPPLLPYVLSISRRQKKGLE
jgi:hypothetical protein